MDTRFPRDVYFNRARGLLNRWDTETQGPSGRYIPLISTSISWESHPRRRPSSPANIGACIRFSKRASQFRGCEMSRNIICELLAGRKISSSPARCPSLRECKISAGVLSLFTSANYGARKILSSFRMTRGFVSRGDFCITFASRFECVSRTRKANWRQVAADLPEVTNGMRPYKRLHSDVVINSDEIKSEIVSKRP